MSSTTTIYVNGVQVASVNGGDNVEVLTKTAYTTSTTPPTPPASKLATKALVAYGSDDIVKSMKVFNDVKATAARWWMTTDFRGVVSASGAAQVKAWKAAGLKEVVITATPSINTPYTTKLADVKAWAKSFRDVYAGTLDAIQVINECDLTKYFSGGYQQAADVFNAVQNELKGSGILCYAPSISEGVDEFGQLYATGIKPDAWDFHPYGKDSKEHVTRVKGVSAIIGTEKLVCTEFGLHSGSFSGWRVEIAKAWEGIKPYVSKAFCYRLICKPAAPAGKFGLVFDDYSQNQECYGTWKSLSL